MNKLLLLTIGLLISTFSYAEKSNFYASAQNSLSLSAAQGYKKTNLMQIKQMASLQYSQPHSVFRLDGRISVEGLYIEGESAAYSVYAAGLSHDIVLLQLNRVYFGVGGGIYLRNEITPNLGSKFAFVAKVFAGVRITDFFGIEAYGNHYSNGDTARPNIGEEFYGASAIIYY